MYIGGNLDSDVLGNFEGRDSKKNLQSFKSYLFFPFKYMLYIWEDYLSPLTKPLSDACTEYFFNCKTSKLNYL